MGREVERQEFSNEDRRAYRSKVRQDLDVLARMLREDRFPHEPASVGMEIELNLVDADGAPALKNTEVLDALAEGPFQTELGQFNLEINMPPYELSGDVFSVLEKDVQTSLDGAEHAARDVGAGLVVVGILPTLDESHLGREVLSKSPRYQVLNDQIFAARGEDILLKIDGVEQLEVTTDSIAPEAACTSTQLHLRVTPDDFAGYWNASQAIAGVQVAVGANSPYLVGQELWRETRIVLFEQATDSRSIELRAQGVRARVWFGEKWVSSVTDLLEENTRYFQPLLPILSDEDPVALLDAGQTPELAEMSLHNGTVYRWNRPVYDVVNSEPHLRVENRVLPAGPTVVDTMANAALYYGLVRALADDDRPVWAQASFRSAARNLQVGALRGIDAELFWPGLGEIAATDLLLRRLLPAAHRGLTSWGVDAGDRDRLLGIIEQRCLHKANGAQWQVGTVRALEERGMDRRRALFGMVERYREHMHSNEPVHTWPLP